MKEYKLTRGWTIFMFFAWLLFILFFGCVLLAPLYDTNIHRNFYYFAVPFCLPMIGLGLVALADTLISKVIIDAQGISIRSILANRQLKFHEIQGYRTDQNNIFVLPKFEELKRIKINRYFGNSDEIIAWLANRYPELDKLNHEQEARDINNNYAFGSTTEERIHKLTQVKKWVKILNWVGVMVASLAFFLPQPHTFTIFIYLGLPLGTLATILLFKGLIRLDSRTDSPYPSVGFSLLFPILALFLIALSCFNILDYSKIWVPALLVAIIFAGIVIYGTRKIQITRIQDYFIIPVFLVLACAYGYGSVVMLNTFFDNSDAQFYQTKVLGKKVSNDKITSYYLNVAPWAKQPTQSDILVSEDLYEEIEAGEKVTISYKKGYFQIPWCEVKE